MKLLVSETGEQHGLVNVLPNSCADKGTDNMKPETKKAYEALRKEDAKVVKARYTNYKGNHERCSKPYMRYAGDPIQMWHFIPGYVYEVPYGLVKEINDPARIIPKRSEIVDGSGKPTIRDGMGERIHEMIPVGF